MIVKKLTAIIGMQFAYPKGQPRQDAPEAAFHRVLTAPEHRHPFTPAARHVDHLEGVDIVALCFAPAVMHQIDLKMARFRLIPGNLAHRYVTRHAIGLFWPSARQAWRVVDK